MSHYTVRHWLCVSEHNLNTSNRFLKQQPYITYMEWKTGQIIWNCNTGEDDVVSSHKEATEEIVTGTWTSIISFTSCASSILKPGTSTMLKMLTPTLVILWLTVTVMVHCQGKNIGSHTSMHLNSCTCARVFLHLKKLWVNCVNKLCNSH